MDLWHGGQSCCHGHPLLPSVRRPAKRQLWNVRETRLLNFPATPTRRIRTAERNVRGFERKRRSDRFSDSAFQQGDTYNNDGAVRALVLDAGNGIAPIEGRIA